MAERSRIEKLDQAIGAMLAGTPIGRVEAEIGELVRLAGELRELPRPKFKEDLKKRLDEEAKMTTATKSTAESAVDLRKGGYHTVTPYLIAEDGPALVEFVKQAFGAEELMRGVGSAGGIHCEVIVGDDSKLLLGGGIPGREFKGEPHPGAIHLYVKDVDGMFRRAVEAGATAVRQPMHQPYGDYDVSVIDPWKNEWYIGRHEATGEKRPGLRTVTMSLHVKGADRLVEFLERAFEAERLELHRGPDGTIVYGQVKMGDSVLEVAEAHGQWQPLASTIFYVAGEVDDAYRRAVESGAKSLYVPGDTPYGMRSAGVVDPGGHIWYLQSGLKKIG